jgi:hypothetical protein
MKGKTIRIYLVDGTPNGVLTAEIINWTGKTVVAPRSLLVDLAQREEAKRTGVYCLVGPDPDNPGKDRVYIGEGDSVLTRITAHDSDETKDFWTRVVLVISKDQNLTKAHVRYLESRLIQMVQLADRASLANGTAPAPLALPEPDVADMEHFLDQIQMVFPVLGFGFLRPKPIVSLPGQPGGDADESPVFVMNQVGACAKARETAGQFVVMKGSTARKQGVPSWTSYKPLRDQLVQDGKLVDGADSQYYVFAEDVAFSSPSAAAAIIRAGNANGRLEWRAEGTGQTYQDWYEDRLKAAGVERDE